MSTEGTLDLIDGALRDYETSADAMRWTPDEDARDDKWSQIQGMTPSLVIYDEVAVFTDSMLAACQRAGQALASFGEALSRGFAWTAPFSLSDTVALIVEESSHMAHAIYYPGQHIRCHDCHPAANPRPLAISGDAYRRRQKARRRR